MATKSIIPSQLCSVLNMPLADPENVLLTPLHIKLGSIKEFIKTLGRRTSIGFEYIVEKFSKTTWVKLNEIPNQRGTPSLEPQDIWETATIHLKCFLLGLSEILDQQGNGLPGWHQESSEMLLGNVVLGFTEILLPGFPAGLLTEEPWNSMRWTWQTFQQDISAMEKE